MAHQTEFGQHLRQFREAARLTQQELAERAGITEKAISALERGERRYPYRHTVEALATALHLNDDSRTTLFSSARRPDNTLSSSPTAVTPTVAPPPLLPPLIGREADLAELSTRLRAGTTRLLTLTGPGGVGKTAIAQSLARQVRDAFADGVVIVLLAPVQHSERVISAIADAIGLRTMSDQPIEPLVYDYLYSRHLLLVLDNFEHVLDAAPHVTALLSACPRLTVLTTSRASLRLTGEQEYPIAPLLLPALERLPLMGEIQTSPAVQLFVERAKKVAPQFDLTQANATSVAAICRRLDGLPLALELAAARIKFLPPMALLARLDKALPLLVGGARDLPERQQTMRQTVAWSYDLLTASEQTLFRRLSVFVGGWTLEAADAIGNGLDVLDCLSALLDNSLIIRQSDDAFNPRYSMLETIRAYAQEQAATHEESAGLHAAHAEYFMAFLESIEPFMEGAEQRRWFQKVTEDFDNIRAVVAWYLAHGQTEAVARLGWVLRRFFGICGFVREGQQWIERVLSTPLSDRVRGRALFVRALLMLQTNHPAEGLLVIEDAIARYSNQDQDLIRYGYVLASWLALQSGALQKAHYYIDNADERVWFFPQEPMKGSFLTVQGFVALTEGDISEASRLLTESATFLRSVNGGFDLVTNLNVYGVLLQLTGQIETALPHYRESVALSYEIGDKWSLVFGVEGVAGAAAELGDYLYAATLFGAAEALRETTGSMGYGAQKVRDLYDTLVKETRRMLGEQAFQDAWTRGRTMPLADIVTLTVQG